MGLIDTFTAGFQTINKRLWILLIPILLDVFLWAGPRLSAEVLFDATVDQSVILLEQSLAANPQLAAQLGDQAALDEALEVVRADWPTALGINNLAVFVTGPVIPGLTGPAARMIQSPVPLAVAAMPVPSFIKMSGLSTGPVVVVDSPLVVGGSWFLLALLSIPLAGTWLALVARAVVPGPDGRPIPSTLDVLRGMVGVAIWYGVAGAFLGLVILPGFVLASLLSAVVPAIGLLIVALVLAVPLWFRIYAWFWDAAFLTTRRNPWQALLLAIAVLRLNLWRALALIVISTFILFGITAALERLAESPGLLQAVPTPLIVIVAILVNAYLASGLVATSFVFFRDRVAAATLPQTTPAGRP